MHIKLHNQLLRICCWNINGFTPGKFSNINGFLLQYSLILLSETWLKSSTLYDLTLDRYKCINKCRARSNPRAKRGLGGLLCHIHRSIEEGVVHLLDLNSSEDRIWFKLKSYFLAFLKICTLVLYTYLPQNQLIWLLGIICDQIWENVHSSHIRF